VQTAYSSGPPDLVVAGLTVVDPIVGITIGITVLGEAAGAPPWAAVVFVLAGIVAIYGVFQLSKHHPQIRR
jgi:F0F1-type ATP synthase assembly protein I